jgi:hypothetical protein
VGVLNPGVWHLHCWNVFQYNCIHALSLGLRPVRLQTYRCLHCLHCLLYCCTAVLHCIHQVSVGLDPAHAPQLSAIWSAMQALAGSGGSDSPEGKRLVNEYRQATGALTWQC